MKLLQEHINTDHKGNVAEFSRKIGKSRQSVERYIKQGFMWNGQVMKPVTLPLTQAESPLCLTQLNAYDDFYAKNPEGSDLSMLEHVTRVTDRSRTNSVESVVGEMERLILMAQESTGKNPCQILSALVKEMLLSDDSDPCHANGIEFVKACDCALSGGSDDN